MNKENLHTATCIVLAILFLPFYMAYIFLKENIKQEKQTRELNKLIKPNIQQEFQSLYEANRN